MSQSSVSRTDDSVRSLFWPGFALGFLLLATLSCGGLFAALGLGELSFSDLQVGAPAWTPPPIVPTPVEVTTNDQVTPVEGAAGFAIGSAVRNATNSRVNIRQTPGYLGKPDDDVLAQLQPGDRMLVLDGISVADGLNWWRIQKTGDGALPVEGWVAEATASGVKILDAAE
jgi:hypothetical protein